MATHNLGHRYDDISDYPAYVATFGTRGGLRIERAA